MNHSGISFVHMTIEDFEHWFTTVELPPAPVMLHPSTTITNVQHFLDSHLYPLKLKPNERIAQPLMDRLMAFKLLIESNL